MTRSQYIKTYNIKRDNYSLKYAQSLLEDCQKLYPNKVIKSFTESSETIVYLTVYASSEKPQKS